MLHRDETGWASTPRQGPANPTEQRQSGELAAKSVENGDPGIESPVTMIQLRGGPAAGAAGPGQSGPLVRREVAARIRQILRRGLGRLEGRRPAPSASSPEPETGCFCVRSGTSDTAGEAKEASPDPDTERLSHSALAVEPVRHWDADIERRVSRRCDAPDRRCYRRACTDVTCRWRVRAASRAPGGSHQHVSALAASGRRFAHLATQGAAAGFAVVAAAGESDECLQQDDQPQPGHGHGTVHLRLGPAQEQRAGTTARHDRYVAVSDRQGGGAGGTGGTRAATGARPPRRRDRIAWRRRPDHH
eukprot:ctg_71.g8